MIRRLLSLLKNHLIVFLIRRGVLISPGLHTVGNPRDYRATVTPDWITWERKEDAVASEFILPAIMVDDVVWTRPPGQLTPTNQGESEHVDNR